MQAYEAWQTHGNFLTGHPDALTGDVAERFRAASTVTAREADIARTVIAAARDHLSSQLGATTALLLPSASSVAPLRRSEAAERARTATLHLTCMPQPVGAPGGLGPMSAVGDAPVGLSVIGAAGGDHALLRFANHHMRFHL